MSPQERRKEEGKRMKRAVSIGLLLGSLALLAAGCGSGAKSCQDACNKIYDQCHFALKDASNQDIPKGQCVSLCNSGTTGKQQAIDCVMAAPCDLQRVLACIPS
jgi:hypothetical protein